MNNTLIPGAILIDKYLIKKIIFQSPESNIYLSFDQKITEREWVIKEVIPPGDIDPEDLKMRRGKLKETVEALGNFDSPHLAKVLEYFHAGNRDYIVMEYVKGITLEKLCQMSISGFKENEVVPWAIQICEALHSLRNRPQPFIFEVMDPSHIILEENKNIKLINFGLDRFYDKVYPSSAFSTKLEDTSKEYNSFSRTIIYFLTKKEPDLEELKKLEISSKLLKVLQRCLDPQAHAIYNDFLEVKSELAGAVLPDKKDSFGKKPATAISKLPKVKIFIHNTLVKIFSQKLPYLVMEILVIIILLYALNAVTRYEKPFVKSSPIIYVLCEAGELLAINQDTKAILTRRFLNKKFNSIVSNKKGDLIFLSANDSPPSIVILSIKNFQPVAVIPVDKFPENLLLSPDERKLFVIHAKVNNLSIISLPEDIQKNPKDIKLTAILPLGRDPKGLSISNFNHLLYVPNYSSDSVSIIDAKDNKYLLTAEAVKGPVKGQPASVAPSQLKNHVYVAVYNWGEILSYEIKTKDDKAEWYFLKKISNLNGGKPNNILLDKKENYLYAACAKPNCIGVISLVGGQLALKEEIKLKEEPLRLLLDPSNELWVISKNSKELLIVNTYTKNMYPVKITSKPVDFCFSQ